MIHNLAKGSDFLFWLLKGAALGLPHTCTPPILKPTQIPQKSTNCLSTESKTKANKHKQPMNPESFNNQRHLLVQTRKLSFLISQLSLWVIYRKKISYKSETNYNITWLILNYKNKALGILCFLINSNSLSSYPQWKVWVFLHLIYLAVLLNKQATTRTQRSNDFDRQK